MRRAEAGRPRTRSPPKAVPPGSQDVAGSLRGVRGPDFEARVSNPRRRNRLSSEATSAGKCDTPASPDPSSQIELLDTDGRFELMEEDDEDRVSLSLRQKMHWRLLA